MLGVNDGIDENNGDAEMPFLRALLGYGMTGHKRNEDIREAKPSLLCSKMPHHIRTLYLA
jgi:hypothetical protein